MKPDDKSLFLEAMDDVKPLKNASCTTWQKPKPARAVASVDVLQLDNFLTTGYLDIVPLNQPLEFKREGVQQGVLDKLRQKKSLLKYGINFGSLICYKLSGALVSGV